MSTSPLQSAAKPQQTEEPNERVIQIAEEQHHAETPEQENQTPESFRPNPA
jgi:hypothetical protein